MTKDPIAISHLGLCTPLGNHPEIVLQRLIAGDTSGMQWRDNLLFERPTLVGEIKAALPEIPASMSQFNTRNNQLALQAAQSISSAVEQAKQKFGPERIAVIIGTSTSGIESGEQALKFYQRRERFPVYYHYAQQELGDTSRFLQAFFALSGPCYSVSTACSSSAKVFASAQRLLQADVCDVVIVGGVDSLCQLTLNGFDALASVSDGHCQPFSANRDGINIGEAAALFVLEKAKANQDQILLASIGESSDAHHISAPHPQGLGAIAAMQSAIREAKIDASQIDYLNLHGTATPKNDAMESLAVSQVFKQTLPFCSSTKSLTGHTLGAAGALEAAFCYLVMSDHNPSHALPPQIWDGEQDSNNPQLPLVKLGQQAKVRYAMSNSFAFGGSNTSIVLARPLVGTFATGRDN